MSVIQHAPQSAPGAAVSIPEQSSNFSNNYPSSFPGHAPQNFLDRKIQCEKCPSLFETQSQLITHILTTPDHLNGPDQPNASFGANNSYNSIPAKIPSSNDIQMAQEYRNHTHGNFNIKPEYRD